MLTLYGFGRSRSLRVAWALEEAGVPYDYRHVDARGGEQRLPPFLALNPGGKVPVLDTGEALLTESLAIVTWVGERFAPHLMPGSDPDARAAHLRWGAFVIGELEQPLWTQAKHSYALPEAWRVPAVLDTARREWAVAAGLLSRGLGERPWIHGEAFTLTDVLVGHTLQWARLFDYPLGHDNLERYADAVAARPAWQAAVARVRLPG